MRRIRAFFYPVLLLALLCSCRQKVQGPTIEVGIVSGAEIPFILQGKFTGSNGTSYDTGQYTATADWAGITLVPSDTACRFTLQRVLIGIGFHWERNEQQTFQGSLKFISESDGQLTAVNIIPVEDYLLSVIASEMKATANTEFLKAHSIISRSWLLASMYNGNPAPQGQTLFETDSTHIKWYEREAHKNFDVCADDHCQRYQGTARACTPQVREAIESTRGIVLCDSGGDICDARFSKCCGGRTELFSSTWADCDFDYLQSVEDPFCNTSDKEIISQVLNGYDLETTGFYRWTVRYTAEELADIILKKSGIDFGRIISLEPLRRGPSDRITELKITGTLRTLTVGKELEIRKFLSPSHLYSSAFDVETEQTDGEPYPSAFILHGKGWGHGVGLCQIGAAVMAAQGFTCEEILRHYYPNTTLTRLY